MATQTAERIETKVEIATNKGDVAIFRPSRLPYHEAIKDRFGVDRAGWKALVEAIYPSAKTADSVIMALSYCRARNLDPFKRPVHIVPMWDSKSGGYVETVWPGIAELRTTAFRTGQYAGCDEAEFGPTIERAFTGRVKVKGDWTDKTITVEFPEWCRITVHRELNGRVCRFVGPKVKWLESYAAIGNSDVPNEMWESRPEGQLEKCAEAAALRKAFPEEIGNDLTAEEMAGRRLHDPGAAARDVTPAPKPPRPVDAIEPAPAAPVEESTTVEAAEIIPPKPPVPRDDLEIPPALRRPKPMPNPNVDNAAWRQWIADKLAAANDADTLDVAWNEISEAIQEVLPPDYDFAMRLYSEREAELSP